MREANRIITFIKKTFQKEGFKKGIIAVSGGVDSSVALVLTAKALEVEVCYDRVAMYPCGESQNSD